MSTSDLAWSIANSRPVSKRLAEEEILEVPYKMRCMPDEAVLKHNRDVKCLERQTSAAMFDMIAPIPFVSIEQERSQRYKLSLVENSFVVVQACAREE
jgi:hypothetical protein